MYDVIVVGGGPGGAAAAIACTNANLRVVLLEKIPFPREHPGETLHPGIEPLLKQLGVLDQVLSAGFLRHSGTWVKWEQSLQFIPFGEDESGVWQGFQAWRSDFDLILLDKAKDLGVEVIQPCHAFHLITYEGRAIGVETSQGVFTASFTIDASGDRHWLAKQLGLNIQHYSPPRIAHYGYARGECPIRDDAPAIIADERGWTWTAKVRPRIYQWTRLTFEHERIDRVWVPDEFSKLKAIDKSRVADVTWRLVDRPAGLGYFLIGDAAAILDPASSHGVLKAIMSGIMAAYLIAQVFNHTQPEHLIIQEYCQWVHNWFQHDIEKLEQLYALIFRECL